jgi:hypothetical protein
MAKTHFSGPVDSDLGFRLPKFVDATLPSAVGSRAGTIVYNSATESVVVSNGTDWNAVGGGGYNYVEADSAYTASANDYIFADTSSGIFTVTLPADPNAGDTVVVLDAEGSFLANPLTLDRNGSVIMGVGEDMQLKVSSIESRIIYTGSQWRVVV